MEYTTALTPEQMESNEEAVAALICLMGLANFNCLPEQQRSELLTSIRQAVPDDSLGGLRRLVVPLGYDGIEIAESPENHLQGFIEPKIARWWLNEFRQDTASNKHSTPNEDPDHLTLAIRKIAESNEGADLYAAYCQVSPNEIPHAPSIIRDMARTVVDSYYTAMSLKDSSGLE